MPDTSILSWIKTNTQAYTHSGINNLYPNWVTNRCMLNPEQTKYVQETKKCPYHKTDLEEIFEWSRHLKGLVYLCRECNNRVFILTINNEKDNNNATSQNANP